MSSTDSFVSVRDLDFAYSNSPQSLFEKLTAVFPRGFTAVVGANGAGKSTLLKLMAGYLKADSGTLSGTSNATYCEQRTDDAPPVLVEMMADWDAEAFELRGRLRVPDDCLRRWSQLSHGERKRVQIACALWQRPNLLLLDEPTNHIDGDARQLLVDALDQFKGVGVLVSHDRELLDALCEQTLWLQGACDGDVSRRLHRGASAACTGPTQSATNPRAVAIERASAACRSR